MVLAECGSFGGQLAVLQADAAAGVAARECHGDGGVGALARAAGLFKRDAASQVKTVEKLQEMPAVRDAVESGEISVANARVLAAACEKTSGEQVEQDGDLLAQAAVLSPEQFAREAGRWAARRQVDDGEERYRRQRARRRLSFWDGDDGMVHLRGELDPVTGAMVRKRFSQEAERLRRADLHGAGGEKRSLDQRMADALETLSSHGSIYSRAEGAAPAGHGARTDGSRGESAPERGSDSDGGGGGQAGDGVVSRSGGDVSRARNASSSLTGGGRCGCGGPPSADVTIVQHLDADGTAAFAEVAGGGVIPQSVFEEHFCNARITGVVFSSEGVPLWHGHAKRLATKAQMNAVAGPLRGLRGLWGGHVDMSGPPRQTGAAGRSHQHRQHDVGVLGLPPEDPSPRLAGGSRRAGPLHHRTARTHPPRTRPRPRPATGPRTIAPTSSHPGPAAVPGWTSGGR